MNFPLRYLYDDRKLRNRALIEFARALRNDRMIAITGSMSDEALGYFSWRDFEEQVGSIAEKLRAKLCRDLGPKFANPEVTKLLKTIADHASALKDGGGGKMEARVRFGVIRDCFESVVHLPGVKSRLARLHRDRSDSAAAGTKADQVDRKAATLPAEEFSRRIAKLFEQRRPGEAASPAAIRPLLESLGISRIATLNYDFELERALMLRQDERKIGEKKGKGRDDRINRPVLDLIGQEGSGLPIVCNRNGRLSRVMGDGLTVESDIMDRERPDRLFEFAVGSAEVDRHILHLHGRADRPSSMVVTIRDYDRLYRRDDLFRNPFEHGMRVLFAGNPVLFVGLGMTENELNDFLQYFVSNTPYRRMAPAFLIWNTLCSNVDQRRPNAPLVRRTAREKRRRTKEAMRVDYLQRLGIHVIFDEDLQPLAFHRAPNSPDSNDDWLADSRRRYEEARPGTDKRQIELKALVKLLQTLPDVVSELNAAADRTGDGRWRSILPRVQLPPATRSTEGEPIRFWGTPTLQKSVWRDVELANYGPGSTVDREEGSLCPTILVGVGLPGCGRGGFSERMAQLTVDPEVGARVGDWVIRHTEPSHRLLVNAGFCYDTDAMLNAIALFLQWRNEKPEFRKAERICREEHFADGSLFAVEAPALIIINGIDRFFGFDGQPLSAELDHLLRCVHGARERHHKIQWMLIGSDRVRSYFLSLGIAVQELAGESLSLSRPATGNPPPVPVNSRYLDWVAGRFTKKAEALKKARPLPETEAGGAKPTREITEAAKARIRTAKAIDPESIRRAFFAGYLAPPLLQGLGFDCPTTFELLRTMAFIGSPVEAVVLLHAPKVHAIVEERCEGRSPQAFLLRELNKLKDVGLVLPVAPCARTDQEMEPQMRRFGLHRSLATELRERHGAPISEAKLSTTFNMSLFAAQPGDTYLPDEHFHDELGELVDRLIGAWKDRDPSAQGFPVRAGAFYAAEEAATLIFRPPERSDAFDMFRRLCAFESAACLRAALAVIRGYYSTSSLLTLGSDSRLVTEHREGALSEHGDRLDRMLKGFGKIATARMLFRRLAFADRPEDERDAEISARLGPEPFYPDDLVWLHNERGVVKLAQGHLYDARRSFSLAENVNLRSLEFGHRGHNWRRINLNVVGLLIERGQLQRAERRIDAIDESIENAPWRMLGSLETKAQTASETDPAGEAARPGSQGRVAAIRSQFGGREDEPVLLCESPHFTREEILMAGLTTSYRALIEHMRGRYRNALPLYLHGMRILRRLSETRAYALFQRHYASLGKYLGSLEERRREADLAVVAADATRQQDISHRARIARAAQIRRDPASSADRRRMALHDLHRALDYAALTDSYRVRIEASTGLAHHMRESGDYDTALRYASDALAIACRYGHSLHKIALRVDIGQLLIRRGDPHSGKAMIDRAVQSAMRTGFHKTMERVQNTRQQSADVRPLGTRHGGLP